MEEETFINKRITNKDIYETLMEVKEDGKDTKEHVKYTNGTIADMLKQIAVIEKKSLGCWIARNPFKFSVGMVVFMSVVISDLRHPIIDLLIKAFL
jgi:hypothetical protein